jgi:hypothetical protein
VELKNKFVDAFTEILREADQDNPSDLQITPLAIKLANKAQAFVDESLDEYWDSSGCSF